MKKSSKLLVLFSFLLVLISSCSSEKLHSQLHQKLLEQRQEEEKEGVLFYDRSSVESKEDINLSDIYKDLYIGQWQYRKPTIENELKYTYQKAIYQFVLDKTQTVAYREKQVVLYNKEGKKISFYISVDRDEVYTYAILEKGEYILVYDYLNKSNVSVVVSFNLV